MFKTLLSAAALLLAAPFASADFLSCPPAFPGHPPIPVCADPPANYGSCIAQLKVNYIANWTNQVKTYGTQRCASLAAIDALIAEEATLNILKGDLEMVIAGLVLDLLNAKLDCDNGDPAACSMVTSLTAEIDGKNIVLDRTTARLTAIDTEIAARLVQIDIWVGAGLTAKAALDAQFGTDAIACCEAEEQSFVAANAIVLAGLTL